MKDLPLKENTGVILPFLSLKKNSFCKVQHIYNVLLSGFKRTAITGSLELSLLLYLIFKSVYI